MVLLEQTPPAPLLLCQACLGGHHRGEPGLGPASQQAKANWHWLAVGPSRYSGTALWCPCCIVVTSQCDVTVTFENGGLAERSSRRSSC